MLFSYIFPYYLLSDRKGYDEDEFFSEFSSRNDESCVRCELCSLLNDSYRYGEGEAVVLIFIYVVVMLESIGMVNYIVSNNDGIYCVTGGNGDACKV